MVKVNPKFDSIYTNTLVKERIPTIEELESFEKNFPEIAQWVKDQVQSLPPKIPPLPKPTLKRKPTTLETSVVSIEKPWTFLAIEQLAQLEKFSKTGDPKNKNIMFKLFFHPVNPEELQCFDYFNIIKNLMDFGTVETSIDYCIEFFLNHVI